MIPKAKPHEVKDHLGEGEAQQFTIAATGKAFRVLIDGLYSDKVLSIVRELWSNARDSHVDANNPKVPFKCDIPTPLSPVFRVRDYGTGLNHEDVMHLYTTIFKSSKTESNSAVGMLGLGSKSPFAYTDSFSVIAYDGGSKRVYNAYIQTDGVPTIRHISTDASSEPRGLEVSFAVNRVDHAKFTEAAQAIAYGFDVLPDTPGVPLQTYETFLKLGNVRIVEDKTNRYSSDAKVRIKQGCVLYPVASSVLRDAVKNDKMIIIEVPIGTVDVTASREALSMDETTRKAVDIVLQKAANKITEYINTELEKAGGQYDRVMKAVELAKWSNFITHEQTQFVLIPDHIYSKRTVRVPTEKQLNEFALYKYYSRKDWSASYVVHPAYIHSYRFVIDDVDKVVRKASRLQSYIGHHTNTYIISYKHGDIQKKIARLKRILRVKDSQFIRLEDLPDDGPPAAKRVKKEGLKAGEVWALRSHGKLSLPDMTQSSRYYSLNEFPNWMIRLFGMVGLPNPWSITTNVKFFTEKEAIRLKLDPAQRIDILCAEALKKKDLNLDGYALWNELRASVSGVAYEEIWNEYFPNIPIVREYNETLHYYFRQTGQLDPACAKMKVQVERLAKKLPLLFSGDKSKQAIMEYIQMKEAKP